MEELSELTSNKDLMRAQLGGFLANTASSSSAANQDPVISPNISGTATPASITEESARADRNNVERVGREKEESAERRP